MSDLNLGTGVGEAGDATVVTDDRPVPTFDEKSTAERAVVALETRLAKLERLVKVTEVGLNEARAAVARGDH